MGLPAVAGVAASSRTGRAREIGARSVTFTPADDLTAAERTRHERYMKLALDMLEVAPAEPCPMCMSAIVWTRIPEVVYGTSVEDLIKFGVNQFRLDSTTIAAAAPFYSGQIVGGVLRERADPIYRGWASRFK